MNPLRIDDKPGRDTRYQVRNVLAFMGEAFEALELQSDVMPTGAHLGAAQIMHLCADALREADREGSADGG